MLSRSPATANRNARDDARSDEGQRVAHLREWDQEPPLSSACEVDENGRGVLKVSVWSHVQSGLQDLDCSLRGNSPAHRLDFEITRAQVRATGDGEDRSEPVMQDRIQGAALLSAMDDIPTDPGIMGMATHSSIFRTPSRRQPFPEYG